MDTEKSSEGVRAARKELHEKVRNDWDDAVNQVLPNIPESYLPYQWRPQQSEPSNLQSQQRDAQKRYPFRASAQVDTDNTDHGPYSFINSLETAGGDAIDWRERTYAPSDPSSDEESNGSLNPVDGILNKLGIVQKQNATSSEDRKILEPNTSHQSSAVEGDEGENDTDAMDEESDTTDDGEDFASLTKDEQKKVLRTKRRRGRLENEMKWNSGLRYWEMRRDIWCCAKPRTQLHDSDSQISPATTISVQTGTKLDSSPANPDQLSNHDTSISIKQENQHDLPNGKVHSKPTRHIPSMILPVAPSLISAGQQSRSIITPLAYPAIYNKLVTQSLSPSLPLNLSSVVPALVEGWKANGDWPTGTPADPTLAVNLASGLPDKRSSHGNGLSAIADATKSGLRALGSKATPNGSSKKPDTKSRMASKGKRWLRSNQEAGEPAQAESQRQPTQNTTEQDAKNMPKSNHARHSSTSTPDSFAQQNGPKIPKEDAPPDQDTRAKAPSPTPGSVGTGSTSGSAHEVSSPQRMRRSVAKVGKAIKGGFTVSPASADGAGP